MDLGILLNIEKVRLKINSDKAGTRFFPAGQASSIFMCHRRNFYLVKVLTGKRKHQIKKERKKKE